MLSGEPCQGGKRRGQTKEATPLPSFNEESSGLMETTVKSFDCCLFSNVHSNLEGAVPLSIPLLSLSELSSLLLVAKR